MRVGGTIYFDDLRTYSTGVDKRSEAQLRKGDQPWEGSVERKPRADEQEPDRRRCQAGRAGKKPRSSCGQGDVAYIRRLCGEGVCSYPGRSRLMPERAT